MPGGLARRLRRRPSDGRAPYPKFPPRLSLLGFGAPLAYLSPRIIQAIAEGRAPADMTVTQLTRNLPLPRTEQEEQLGLG